jgi:hypothetical protein
VQKQFYNDDVVIQMCDEIIATGILKGIRAAVSGVDPEAGLGRSDQQQMLTSLEYSVVAAAVTRHS